jgi:hypothetical protein
VQANFGEIRAALDARERETLDALAQLHDRKKAVLEQQLGAIETQRARIEDGVRNVSLVLNHSNDLEVVYLTYVLQNHVAALTDVPSTSPLAAGAAGPDGNPVHSPAVDAELPVVLSGKVPQLVKAYASVADADTVDAIATGKKSAAALQADKPTKEQQEILKQVAGAKVDGGEYGCALM